MYVYNLVAQGIARYKCRSDLPISYDKHAGKLQKNQFFRYFIVVWARYERSGEKVFAYLLLLTCLCFGMGIVL